MKTLNEKYVLYSTFFVKFDIHFSFCLDECLQLCYEMFLGVSDKVGCDIFFLIAMWSLYVSVVINMLTIKRKIILQLQYTPIPKPLYNRLISLHNGQ